MPCSDSHWIAPPTATLPDFIICGAMKSGTSTLHYILNEHPDLFIPNRELYFFDVDDILQHGPFNFYIEGEWHSQCIEKNPAVFWQWYSSQFGNAGPSQVLGEDSTTYLASESAARRIALQRKPIKLLVILRHPTARAYSQYWHMLRTGRMTHSFEHTLRYHPHSVLDRSMYYQQLKRFREHLRGDRIRVVLFEEFLSDKRRVIGDVCGYIGVDYNAIPSHALEAHDNPSRIPKYPAVQMLKNRLLPGAYYARYRPVVPVPPPKDSSLRQAAREMVGGLHRRLNRARPRRPPPMKPATARLLDAFFERELAGLDELVGREVLNVWFPSRAS